jgi:neuroligin
MHPEKIKCLIFQNTTVEALKLPWWRQITHNLEHYFLSGAPFMDPVYFSEEQQVMASLLF